MAKNNGFGASLAAECWKNAEDLWGDFKHADFGKIILPFTLLRRLECVLEPTRGAVRKACEKHAESGIDLGAVLGQITGYPFYNTSEYTLSNLGSTKTRQNLVDYVAHFSENSRVIFEQFDFTNTVIRLDRANLLYRIAQNFANINLHPEHVPERVMSNLYEHLIRRFGAEVNEGAEDFMTPRDVVHLATTLLLDPDEKLFGDNPGLVRTIYDPTCGTGGFLSDAMNFVSDYAEGAKVPPSLIPYGQELEPETHAVSLANMLLRHHPTDPHRDVSQNIAGPASTLSEDAFAGEHFNYCLANPPFGKKWSKDEDAVRSEHKEKGFEGRFGPGLPRISDGSMLFLLHLAEKLEAPKNGGGRAAIVLSGSPLFNGGAGSGESEIRRWLLESDLVDAIVALPTELFFRTGIATYLWILSNKKPESRQGKVQLIDATGEWESMKNEGNKRRRITSARIRHIADLYSAFETGEHSKVYDYPHFGYRRIRVLRPLRMTLTIDKTKLKSMTKSIAWSRVASNERVAWREALLKRIGKTYRHDWAEEIAKEQGKDKPTEKDRNAIRFFLSALAVELGKRDPDGEIMVGPKGKYVADKELMDYEIVPLSKAIEDYFAREVVPFVPDAWIDESYRDKQDGEIGRVGYEINFNRYFYKYDPPRSLEEIDADLEQVEAEISELLNEVME